MLQRGATGEERVRKVVIQETAYGSHVDVREATQTPGEVSGVVACSEDAAELRVEQVLNHRPATEKG